MLQEVLEEPQQKELNFGTDDPEQEWQWELKEKELEQAKQERERYAQVIKLQQTG